MFISKLKAVAIGLVYLIAPVSLPITILLVGAAVFGRRVVEFAKNYFEYLTKGEWFDDLRLRVFWPLRSFYFASVANRLIGIMAALSLPGFLLAHLFDGFRSEGGFQGFLATFVDDLRDIRNAVVDGRAL